MKPQPKLRGWAIASACLPSLNLPREDRIIQSSILEVSGHIPEGSPTEIILALVQKFNEDLCPMLNGLGRELTLLISLIFCTKNQTILKIFLLSDSQINPQKTSYSKTESCCVQQAKHLCSSLHTYLLRTHKINKKS